MMPPASVSAKPASLRDRLRGLYARRETIRYLVTANLKAGHRDKVLGNLWNLLDPLLSLSVYYLIFGVLFRQASGGAGDYLVYLFIGILSWRFLDGAVSQAVNSIRGNRGLVHEINFPKAVFPISICLSRLYDFMWGLLVLTVVVLLSGRSVTWHALWVPPLIFLQLVLTVGVAYIVAYLGAFYADTANVTNVVLRIGFYASPILYYVGGQTGARVSEKWLPIYMLNPIACLLEGYRNGLVYHQAPDPQHTLYVIGFALVVLIVGFGLFSRGEGVFAKYV